MEQRDMIRMANQIATFFNAAGGDAAVKETAEHINKFWDPHMRAQLFAHLDRGGEGLDATIINAATLVRRPKAEAA